MYDQRVRGGGRRGAQRFPEARARRGAMAGDQARLHRPAARPPAARVRRDLLQLGRLPGPAPALLPQRLHLLAARRSPPSTSRASAPTYRCYYPTARRPARHAAARSSPASACRTAGRTSSATCATWCARCAALPAAGARAARPADPGAPSLFFRNKGAYIVGRLINGDHDYPFAVPILQNDARRALPRRAADRRGRAAGAVLSFARAYFFVDMEVPVGLRHVPALADAEQAARRALHGGRPAEAGQDPLLPRPPLPPQAFHRPFVVAPGIKGMVMLVFTLPSSRTSSR